MTARLVGIDVSVENTETRVGNKRYIHAYTYTYTIAYILYIIQASYFI